jgi:hypothetical protein
MHEVEDERFALCVDARDSLHRADLLAGEDFRSVAGLTPELDGGGVFLSVRRRIPAQGHDVVDLSNCPVHQTALP